ncbi:MAG TPA: glycosyltransferase family 39 protein [Phycisphaerales bacterium]|nr:glycosyltransferase family 39 protein [Phycisphaerales bacterium]
MPLLPEEAYYWLYSENPALSYFDHPPMVAWMIGLGTAIGGLTEFGVRLVGCLMGIGSAGLMYALGRIWSTRRTAVLSALLVLVLPVFFGAGLIATMDSAVMFFWMLSLVTVSLALRRGDWWMWYAAGASIGLTMLSKYTGVFLGLGTALAIVGRMEWRRHLLSFHPYLGGLLAWAVFSPVLIWNWQHDWASFKFQFVDRWEARDVYPKHALTFLLGQVVVLTPVLLAGMAGAVISLTGRWKRVLTQRWVFALAFSAPLLAQMAWKSIWYSIHINWTLPAYLSALPLTCGWMLAVDRGRKIWSIRAKSWEGMLTATIGVCAAIVAGVSIFMSMYAPKTTLVPAVEEWQSIAQVVEEHEELLEPEKNEEPLIIADGRYRLAAPLSFYCTKIDDDERASKYITSQWLIDGEGLGFKYWSKESDWIGRNCVYLDDRGGDPREELEKQDREIARHFESVEFVDDARLSVIGRGKYRIALCRNYLGINPDRQRKKHRSNPDESPKRSVHDNDNDGDAD